MGKKEARVGVIVQTPDEGKVREDQLAVIREFVLSMRAKYEIVPGPNAQGFPDDNYGDAGEIVMDDCIRTPDGGECWRKLAQDPALLARAVAFVHGEIRRQRNI